jgi:hypothetical protein
MFGPDMSHGHEELEGRAWLKRCINICLDCLVPSE